MAIKRTERVTVRLRPCEVEHIRTQAERHGDTVAEFLRRVVDPIVRPGPAPESASRPDPQTPEASALKALADQGSREIFEWIPARHSGKMGNGDA